MSNLMDKKRPTPLKSFLFLVLLCFLLHAEAIENSRENTPSAEDGALVDHGWLQDRDYKLCQTTVNTHNIAQTKKVSEAGQQNPETLPTQNGHTKKEAGSSESIEGHSHQNSSDGSVLIKKDGVLVD